MSFFECNLPATAPAWMEDPLAVAYEQAAAKVSMRTFYLNKALSLSGLDGNTFAKYAAHLFEMKQEQFDSYRPQEIADYAKLLDDGTKTPERLEFPNAVVLYDTAFTTREEWETLRHIGIGGSDAAIIMGVSPWNSGSSLYRSKVGLERKQADDTRQAIFDRGHTWEPRVIEAFCKATGAVVIPETRMFASKRFPICTANIDAIVQMPDGRIFVFEAKTTATFNMDKWKDDKIPAYYIHQMRQYPAVLDDDRIVGTYIGCLFTTDYSAMGTYIGSETIERNFTVRYLPSDIDEENALLEAEGDWFEKYVEYRTEPPFVGDIEAMKTERESRAKCQNPGGTAPSEKLDAAVYGQTIADYLDFKGKQSEAIATAKQYEEAAIAKSLELVTALGGREAAMVNVDASSYYEVKNSPRYRTKIDTETLLALFDTLAPSIPQETLAKLRGCIKKEESHHVFSVKLKKRKKV